MNKNEVVAAERGIPDYLIVGQIVAPFGVKGELKATILTEFPDRFSRLEQIIVAPFEAVEPERVPSGSLTPAGLKSIAHEGSAAGRPRVFRPPSGPTPFGIEGVRLQGGQLMLKLSGVDDADAAETLRAFWLLIPTESARRLPYGAYYLYQIIGLDVYTTAGELVGKVTEVLTHTANDVYIVQGPGVTDPTGELLVPALKSIVKSIEVEQGRIVIEPPEEWA